MQHQGRTRPRPAWPLSRLDPPLPPETCPSVPKDVPICPLRRLVLNVLAQNRERPPLHNRFSPAPKRSREPCSTRRAERSPNHFGTHLDSQSRNLFRHKIEEIDPMGRFFGWADSAGWVFRLPPPPSGLHVRVYVIAEVPPLLWAGGEVRPPPSNPPFSHWLAESLTGGLEKNGWPLFCTAPFQEQGNLLSGELSRLLQPAHFRPILAHSGPFCASRSKKMHYHVPALQAAAK